MKSGFGHKAFKSGRGFGQIADAASARHGRRIAPAGFHRWLYSAGGDNSRCAGNAVSVPQHRLACRVSVESIIAAPITTVNQHPA
jgi:hypothetical protein